MILSARGHSHEDRDTCAVIALRGRLERSFHPIHHLDQARQDVSRPLLVAGLDLARKLLVPPARFVGESAPSSAAPGAACSSRAERRVGTSYAVPTLSLS